MYEGKNGVFIMSCQAEPEIEHERLHEMQLLGTLSIILFPRKHA